MVLVTYIVSAALALLASPAAAAPTEDWKTLRGWNGVVSSPKSIGVPLDSIAARLVSRAADTVGGIFICDGLNWTGTCGYAVQPLNTCIVLGDDWNNKISSLGPDPGAVVIAYDANNCAGNSTAFVFPGSGDLASLGWDNTISSFKAIAD